jgi:hypothetical protein
MRTVKRRTISAHPYLFDTFFRALRWCGSGKVTIQDIAGGVNQARCVVEADDEGYLALRKAGFVVEVFGHQYHEAASSARK